MVFPHTSRGKRILALIDKHNNSPIEEVTPNDTSDEKANQTSYEVKSLPNESSSSCSSSPNSNSSADSDSSDETFIEDSDDSVKDPMYIPPEQLFQQKRAEFIETIECSTPLPSTSTADRLITFSEPPPLPYQRSPESLVEQRNKNYTATNFDSVNPLSSTSIENSIKASSPASPKAKKGRKRKRNEENWKRNVNKMLRNTGKAYKSASNKIKEERKIKEPCGDKCRLQCKSKLSEDERMLLFKNYWALGDNKKQWEYISKSMSIITPKYRYIREGGIRKPRNKNHAFHFKLPDKSVRVPKKDMCDVCAAFENSDNKENLKEEHDKHLKEKELCRAEKAKDKLNENIVTAVYDLQAVFQCPKGHTQNEGDAAHSLIERQVKKLLKAGPMYTPEAFIGAIKMARKNPEPFHVNEMCTEDFVDWKDACTQMGVNLTKDEEGNSVKIGNIKILKIEKDNPRILFYKNSYGEEEFKKAEIIRKKKRIDVNVKKAYDCKPGISDRKKADLLDLLNKNLIPQFYARFYNSL
ncbi:uncharacterized protein LOC123654873 [Melitaea cinxia]|uniref:uncharacterized protein LOC123654873 n=1 Tax=Melitaea cinxia TaxID=113334 RepID=UPI001E273180|nr:uncharacterized protein LOC123654873 [Melitaea cinxia]